MAFFLAEVIVLLFAIIAHSHWCLLTHAITQWFSWDETPASTGRMAPPVPPILSSSVQWWGFAIHSISCTARWGQLHGFHSQAWKIHEAFCMRLVMGWILLLQFHSLIASSEAAVIWNVSQPSYWGCLLSRQKTCMRIFSFVVMASNTRLAGLVRIKCFPKKFENLPMKISISCFVYPWLCWPFVVRDVKLPANENSSRIAPYHNPPPEQLQPEDIFLLTFTLTCYQLRVKLLSLLSVSIKRCVPRRTPKPNSLLKICNSF